MQTFVLYLHDILVMLECRAFYFIASSSTCSFDQQSCSCQSIIIILSWDHDHQSWFVIQIQVMSFVCRSYKMRSYLLTHLLYYSWWIQQERVISLNYLADMNNIFANTTSWSHLYSQSDHLFWNDMLLRVMN